MQKKTLIGVIGGSGLYAMQGFQKAKTVTLETPFGQPSGDYVMGTLGGAEVVFLPRHGVGHVLNPSEINFRANIWGMKKLGVSAIISVSAVGSLKEEIKPGHMVVIDQFFDRTRLRPATFFEKGIVAHVSFADPVCAQLRAVLVQAAKKSQATVHAKGTYVCMEGPQFSTRAESHWYRNSLGADVIGMTNLQEAKLAREAEICYATLALATDYDCWHEGAEAVTTEQIIAILGANVQMAQKIIATALDAITPDANCPCQHALKHAILTDHKMISKEARERLEIIIGKYIL